MEIFIAAFSLCEDNGQWCVYTKTLLIGSVYGSRPQKSQTTEKLQVRESLGTYL